MKIKRDKHGRFTKGHIPIISGENHPAWKGDKASYVAIHIWVSRKLGKANKCEDCQSLANKKYEWANISGKYKRDISDYKQLCTSCHRKYDYKQISFPRSKSRNEMIKEIKQETNIKNVELAKKFNLTPARVGQIIKQ